MLAVIGVPALSAVTAVASTGGLLAVILAVPAIWLCVGVALCLACVITSRLLQPKLSANRPLPMFSLEFARYWLVSTLAWEQHAYLQHFRAFFEEVLGQELSMLLLCTPGQPSGPCDNNCFCRAPARDTLPHLVVQGSGVYPISHLVPSPFAHTRRIASHRPPLPYLDVCRQGVRRRKNKCFGNASQGARIGKGGYIDSLDVCDFDLITIGDGVVVNEGATIIGHYFQDGELHFREVHPVPPASLAVTNVDKMHGGLSHSPVLCPKALHKKVCWAGVECHSERSGL